MTKHRTSLRALSASDIVRWAEAGERFEAAAMSGEPGYWGDGRLDNDWAERYRTDREGMRYTVLSYATPIAWQRRDGQWVVPTQRHSQSTSRHQGIVRMLHPQAN